jgi:hypothetical protein
MHNDNLLLGHYDSDTNLPAHDVSVLDGDVKILAEIDSLPSAEKQKQLKTLAKIRNQIETENKQLEKRVKLIKKEEQIVLDKILAGMLHEHKLSQVRTEDEKFKATFQSLRERDRQQTEEKRRQIFELKQKAQQLKKQQSERILRLKRENYIQGNEEKKEALVKKQFFQVNRSNFYTMKVQPKLKFKQAIEENFKQNQERRANEQLEQQTRQEAERLRMVKIQNKTLLKEQLKAYDSLIKERNFHRQFFNTAFVQKKH